jgi:hypothetical protein
MNMLLYNGHQPPLLINCCFTMGHQPPLLINCCFTMGHQPPLLINCCSLGSTASCHLHSELERVVAPLSTIFQLYRDSFTCNDHDILHAY